MFSESTSTPPYHFAPDEQLTQRLQEFRASVEKDPFNPNHSQERYAQALRETLGTRYCENTLWDYTPRDADQEECLRAMVDFHKSKLPFLLLVGKGGLGKTDLMARYWAALTRYTHTMNVHCFGYKANPFNTEIEFKSRWRSATFAKPPKDRDDPTELEKLTNEMKYSQFLFIDDFGKARPSDAWFEFIFEVLDYRSKNDGHTIISTNFTSEPIAQQYDPTLVSRFQMGKIIKFGGPDYRAAEMGE